MQDAVGVDVKGDFDLWHTTWGWRDAVELEGAEGFVVAAHWTLALKHDDFHAGLVIAVGGEDLAVLLRDSRVTRNHRSGDAAGSLDGKSQRSHVEQEHVLDVTFENATLNGCADSDDFIWVDALMRVFTSQLTGSINHLWHTGHATDENKLVDFRSVQFSGS